MSLLALRQAMHREPIITWSLLIGGIGISLPIIVPPIRESLGFGDVTVAPNPPRVKELIEMSKAK